jgi:hypothetical protein
MKNFGFVTRPATTLGLCSVLVLGPLFAGCKNPRGTTGAGALLGMLTGAAAGYAIDGSATGAALGAAAGAAAGAGVGYLIYRKQMHLEAQVAASKARVEEADAVLAKYRRYNEHLAAFSTNATAMVHQLNTKPDPDQPPQDLKEAKENFLAQINEAEKGGQDSVKALQSYLVKLEDAASDETSSAAADAKRKKQLQRIEELKKEEARLIEQLDALTGLRSQVGGGA